MRMDLGAWIRRVFGGRSQGTGTGPELPRPGATYADPNATEMIRVWLAQGNLQIAIRLGMWAEAGDPATDERDAWGYLLADVVQQISHGLAEQCGWDAHETAQRVQSALLKNADGGGNPSGRFIDGT